MAENVVTKADVCGTASGVKQFSLHHYQSIKIKARFTPFGYYLKGVFMYERNRTFKIK